MALAFELVINAGVNRTAADRMPAELGGLAPLPAGEDRVGLQPPLVRAVRDGDGAVREWCGG